MRFLQSCLFWALEETVSLRKLFGLEEKDGISPYDDGGERCSLLSISIRLICHYEGASQVVLVVKNPPTNAGDITDTGGSLGWGDPLEKGMATHSTILAWRIPTDRRAWRTTVHKVANSQIRPRAHTYLFFQQTCHLHSYDGSHCSMGKWRKLWLWVTGLNTGWKKPL